MPTPPSPSFTPQFRTWLEHEQAWGRHALHAIATRRGQLLSDRYGLERFTLRMALVDLTGSVARWAKGLHDGLAKVGRTEAAAAFAGGPPFAATEPATEDCDRLSDYVSERIGLLGDLLAADGG